MSDLQEENLYITASICKVNAIALLVTTYNMMINWVNVLHSVQHILTTLAMIYSVMIR